MLRFRLYHPSLLRPSSPLPRVMSIDQWTDAWVDRPPIKLIPSKSSRCHKIGVDAWIQHASSVGSGGVVAGAGPSGGGRYPPSLPKQNVVFSSPFLTIFLHCHTCLFLLRRRRRRFFVVCCRCLCIFLPSPTRFSSALCGIVRQNLPRPMRPVSRCKTTTLAMHLSTPIPSRVRSVICLPKVVREK